ncbi:BamA/TamA family outer membrane protein [uncultured Imperialibacter sp.]|uniref:translocation and assembly module lipoprotein TamL n=1 Tax=uncultured Imperialibacter sp. TaxID=1672639 RepID=UPI0030DC871E
MNFALFFEIIPVTASIRKLVFITIIAAAFSGTLSGCLGLRYLKEDEKLLYKESIENAKGLNIDELEAQFQQKPNRRTPIFPWSLYVNVYYWGQHRYDSAKYQSKKESAIARYDAKIAKAIGKKKPKKAELLKSRKLKKVAKIDKTLKEGNLFMRWGEEVAVFKPELREQTEQHLVSYLQSEGYFNAGVSSSLKEKGKLVSVTYELDRNKPYVIDSIFYGIPDDEIKDIVLNSENKSLLVKGDRYRQKELASERERVYESLVNKGYYRFNKQLISFQVDTASLGDKKVLIEIAVKSPVKDHDHKRFVIDSVNFITDANINIPGEKRSNRMYHGVNYSFYEERYNKKILDWRVFIYPDSMYSRANTFETQKQLANLDIFKFVNINYDTVGTHFIANIYTSPLQKFQTSTEFGVNVSQGLPGPFLNANIKDRNVFKGLEILELSGRFGIEGVASPTNVKDVYSSKEYGGNLALTFPQFITPASWSRRRDQGRLNPRTRWLVGTTVTDRREYKRTNFNSTWAYIWQKDNKHLFNLTLADVSFIDSELRNEAFRDLLEDYASRGNLLINSFNPSYVGSTSFSVAVNNNSYGITKGNASFFRVFVETSGNTLWFFNQDALINDRLEYYQFSKANFDFRKVTNLSSKHDLAYRFNVGVAVPYGINTVLPYEKYFFAGGSNGIRAWRPRRLGPGSYTPPLNDNPEKDGLYDYSFEQPGEILFETSVEYRRRLFSFVSWAFFIDAGNVWTLRDDATRPGSQFKVDSFAKEIAVGSGFGLRFDFSFLILRLDAGAKIHDPARPPGQRWVFDKLLTNFPFGEKEQTILNIGIGYPF